MDSRFISIFFAILMATTFYHSYVEAGRTKKKIILKGIIGAGLLLKYLKPKKGILPIPLPLPLPLPIELEQPPVVVHPKHHHVPVPHAVPVPVHVPVHVPIHHAQKIIVSDYSNGYGGYGPGYGSEYRAGYGEREYQDMGGWENTEGYSEDMGDYGGEGY